MSRRSPSPPSSSHSPNLNTATHSSSTTSTSSSALHLRRSASSHMSDEDDNIPPPTSTSPLPPDSASNSLLHPSPASARTPSFPVREDCWSEEATHTLVEAWGSHYIELNRGNLRQKQWQEVADAVNAVHAHTKKLQRTDIQCKNRIDTLKKKYKVEKAKFIESNGRYVSPWPFFPELDSLIGDSFLKSNHPPSRTRKGFVSSVPAPSPSPVRKEFLALPPPPSIVPVGPRSKRPAHGMVHSEDLRFRQKSSDMAAMSAMVVRGEEDDEESETSSGVANGNKRRKRRRGEEGGVGAGVGVEVEGYGHLAEAIGRFAEIYERVEEAKQRQMVELEKQRMQFAKDLEIQRMKLFMDSQLHLEKLKLSKRRSQADGYS